VQDAPRAISGPLLQGSARPSCKAAFNRLSIPWRLGVLVLALALPLNLIILGTIWGLIQRANDAQRTSLLYAARSIAAGVDAEFGKFIALGQSLAHSPALLDANLEAFEAEARRAFPAGGRAWVLVADVNGQQLLTPSRNRASPYRAAIRLGSRPNNVHWQRARLSSPIS
jgi:hypothetical protein